MRSRAPAPAASPCASAAALGKASREVLVPTLAGALEGGDYATLASLPSSTEVRAGATSARLSHAPQPMPRAPSHGPSASPLTSAPPTGSGALWALRGMLEGPAERATGCLLGAPVASRRDRGRWEALSCPWPAWACRGRRCGPGRSRTARLGRAGAPVRGLGAAAMHKCALGRFLERFEMKSPTGEIDFFQMAYTVLGSLNYPLNACRRLGR